MSDITEVMGRCRALGAAFLLVGEKIKVQAPQPLPDELVSALKEARSAVLEQLQRERGVASDCWVLEEWRRISIPQWRRILEESSARGNNKSADYARWMLHEVLHDLEYKEPGQ